MKSYFRIMLGPGSAHAAECFAGGFIGADYGIHEDLTEKLPEESREFNREYIPKWLEKAPEKSRVAAGLACGMLWTVAKGLLRGDTVLCPDGAGRYHVGVVEGDYHYVEGGVLPHRRAVRWLDAAIDRVDMSESLKRSSGTIGTVCNLTQYSEEIERLLGGLPDPVAIVEPVADPVTFALEKHLEDFLVDNWAQTDLGTDYSIYEVDGQTVGQQFQTDTGPLDILAISKDGKRLLVVELKKGRASDVVVGQILRYMGYVQDVLAEEGQEVEGVIIALEDDQRIRRALAMIPKVAFYRYEVSFKLVRAGG